MFFFCIETRVMNFAGPWTTFQPSTDNYEYNTNVFYITSWCYFKNVKDALLLFAECENKFPLGEISLKYKYDNRAVSKLNYSIQLISKIRMTNKEHERNNNLSLPDSEMFQQSNSFKKMCNRFQ